MIYNKHASFSLDILVRKWQFAEICNKTLIIKLRFNFYLIIIKNVNNSKFIYLNAYLLDSKINASTYPKIKLYIPNIKIFELIIFIIKK